MTMGAAQLRALDDVDHMSPALRGCVHEFGKPIVDACLQAGVKDPRRIRQLVKEIWSGARQTGQNSGARQSVDWLLSQSVGATSWKTLLRFLADNNLAVVSMSPTRAMLDASMNEVSGHNIRCTREEKHRRRLIAAIKAGSSQ